MFRVCNYRVCMPLEKVESLECAVEDGRTEAYYIFVSVALKFLMRREFGE